MSKEINSRIIYNNEKQQAGVQQTKNVRRLGLREKVFTTKKRMMVNSE